MSSNVDNKIVKITFDCDEFDRKLTGSKEKLDNFDESIKKLEKDTSSSSGTDQLSESMKNVSKNTEDANQKLDNLGSNVESIGDKFTAFGVIGKRVLENLTDQVVALGEQIVSSLSIDNITAGWSKYEAQVSTTQSMMNALSSTLSGKLDDAGLQDYVKTYRDQLAWFSDETSYSMETLSAAMSSFLQSGITDVNLVKNAIYGIGTSAASAGVDVKNSQGVFDAWSKAIASGKLSVNQWDTLEKTYQAINGDFKQILMDTAVENKQLTKTADGVYKTAKGTKVTIGNIRTTLSEGWVNSKVISQTLQKYGNLSNALYSLSENGETAANNLEDLTTVITKAKALKKAGKDYKEIYKTLSESSEKAKSTGETFKDVMSTLGLTEKTLETYSEQYEKIYQNAFEAAQTCKTFADATGAVKEVVATQWSTIFENITGNYLEAKEMWSSFCDYLLDIFTPVWYYLADAFKIWHDYGGRDLLFGLEEIADDGVTITKEAGALWNILDAISDVWQAILDGLAEAFPFLDGISSSMSECEDYEKSTRRLAASFKLIAQYIQEWSKKLKPSEEQLDKISDTAKTFGDIFKFVFNLFGTGLKIGKILLDGILTILKPLVPLFNGFLNKFTGAGEVEGTVSALDIFGQVVQSVANKIAGFIEKVGPNFVGFFESLSGLITPAFNLLSSFLKEMPNLASTIGTTLGDIVTTVLDTLGYLIDTIITWLGTLDGASIIAKLQPVAETIWEVVNWLFWFLIDKIKELDWGKVAQTILDIINEFLPVFWTLIDTYFGWRMKMAVADFADAINFISNTLWYMGSGFRAKEIAKIILNVAIALAILAAACLAFSFVDTGAMASALTMMTVLLAELAAIIMVINTVTQVEAGIKPKDILMESMKMTLITTMIMTVSSAFVKIAIACAIMITAYKASGINLIEFVTVTGALGGIIMEFVGIILLLSEIGACLGPSDITSITMLTKVFNKIASSLMWLTMSITNLIKEIGKYHISGTRFIMITTALSGMAMMFVGIMAIFNTMASANPTSVANIDSLSKTFSSIILVMSLLVLVISKLIYQIGKASLSSESIRSVTDMLLTCEIFSVVMIGVLSLLSKVITPAQISSINAIIGAIAGLSGAMVLMVIAISVLADEVALVGSDNIKTAITALLSMSAIMIIITMFAALIGNAAPTFSGSLASVMGAIVAFSFSLVIMAVALTVLSNAVALSGADAMNNAVKGLMAMTVLFMVIVAMATLISGRADVMGTAAALSGLMIEFAVALSLMAAVLSVLALTVMITGAASLWNAVGALGAISAIFLAFTGLMISIATGMTMETLGKFELLIAEFTSALVGMGVALVLMSGAIGILAIISRATSPGALWNAVGVITVMMAVFLALTIGIGEIFTAFPMVGKWMAIAITVFTALQISLMLASLAMYSLRTAISDAFKPMMEDINALDLGQLIRFARTFFLFGMAIGIGAIPLSAGCTGILISIAPLHLFKKCWDEAIKPVIKDMAKIDFESIALFAAKFILFSAAIGIGAIPLSLGATGLLVASGPLFLFKKCWDEAILPLFKSVGKLDWDLLGAFAAKFIAFSAAIGVAAIPLSLGATGLLVSVGPLYLFKNCWFEAILPILNSVANQNWETIGAFAAKFVVFSLALLSGAALGLLPASISMLLAYPGIALGCYMITSLLIPAMTALAGVNWEIIGAFAAKWAVACAAVLGGSLLLAAAGVGIAIFGLCLIPLATAILMIGAAVYFAMDPITRFLEVISSIEDDDIERIKNIITLIPSMVTSFVDALRQLIVKIGGLAVDIGNTIVTIINAVITTIAKSAGLIASAVSKAIKAILVELNKEIYGIVTELGKLLYLIAMGALQVLDSYTVKIVSKLMTVITNIAVGVANLLKGKEGKELKAALIKFFSTVTDWVDDEEFNKVWDDFNTSIKTIFTKLETTFKIAGIGLADALIAGITAGLTRLGQAFWGAVPDLAIEAFHLLGMMTDDQYNTIKTQKQIYGVASNVEKWVANNKGKTGSDIVGNWVSKFATWNYGENYGWTVEGLKKGWTAYKQELYDQGIQIGATVDKGVKDALGIASPSKVMIENGAWIDAGLAQGIEENTDVVEEATDDMYAVVQGRSYMAANTASEDSFSFWDSIVEAATDVGDKAKNFLSKVWTIIMDAFNGAFGDGLTGIADWATEKFNLKTNADGSIDWGSTLLKIFGIDDAQADEILGPQQYNTGSDYSSIDSYLASLGFDSSTAADSTTKLAKQNNNEKENPDYKNAPTYNIVQNNYSPKALSSTDIYRRTQSHFSKMEGATITK